MSLHRLEGRFEILVHEIAQLLWTHFFRQACVSRDISKQTCPINHLAALLQVDNISSHLVDDLIRNIVCERLSKLLPLFVGFNIMPQDSADESQRCLNEQRDYEGIPNRVSRKLILRADQI